MCRILWIRSEKPIEISDHLKYFASISRNSKEYQGHGWGCAWIEKGLWKIYRNIKPVWEDDFSNFGKTSLFLAHARSAFRDEGIEVENNMPFFDGKKVFIFNGELRGVRIRERGRIGAEKIFNYIKRFEKNDSLFDLKKAINIMTKKTQYIRAMNFIVANVKNSKLASIFNENQSYFQMYETEQKGLKIVCSQPYPGQTNWLPIESKTIKIL